MGPFSSSFGNEYVLLTVDYVFKWVKAVSNMINKATVVVKFLRDNIFSKYGMLRAIISD